MFILFGWGFKTMKVMKQKKLKECAVCGDKNFNYVRTKAWFTLFFIPIIPYSIEYYKVCSHCQNARKMSKERFLASVNAPPKKKPELLEEPFATEFETT